MSGYDTIGIKLVNHFYCLHILNKEYYEFLLEFFSSKFNKSLVVMSGMHCMVFIGQA